MVIDYPALDRTFLRASGSGAVQSGSSEQASVNIAKLTPTQRWYNNAINAFFTEHNGYVEAPDSTDFFADFEMLKRALGRPISYSASLIGEELFHLENNYNNRVYNFLNVTIGNKKSFLSTSKAYKDTFTPAGKHLLFNSLILCLSMIATHAYNLESGQGQIKVKRARELRRGLRFLNIVANDILKLPQETSKFIFDNAEEIKSVLRPPIKPGTSNYKTGGRSVGNPVMSD